MNKWILTKDMVPPLDALVLVTFITKYDYRFVDCAYYHGGEHKDFRLSTIHKIVSGDRVPAWMPLPKAYEE